MYLRPSIYHHAQSMTLVVFCVVVGYLVVFISCVCAVQ